MPVVQANGQRLYVEERGPRNAPAVVFSHGLLMDHRMFEPQLQRLASRYRCIAWDERCHGQSGGADAPFSYYDSAADLFALLDHLQIQEAVLVGMSQGGYLSLRAALRQPQRVRGLVLLNTQAAPEDPEKMPGYQQMMEDWARNGLSESTAETIATIILGQGWEGSAAWKAYWRTIGPQALLQAFHTLGHRDDLSEAVRAIRCPALAIHGEHDLAISVARAQAMASAIGAPLRVIAGGGHAVNLTHATQVTPLIEAFLDQHAGP